MSKHHPANERIKRRYFVFLKDAKGQSESSVDAVAKALNRFEVDTKYRDFKSFHFEQAVAFKKRLAEQVGQRSGQKLSKATMHSTLGSLKRFFQWLVSEPGYRSRLKYSDADYFNLSANEVRIATAQREQPSPTLEQVKHVIATMPVENEIDKRNRALIAFTLLTGARDGAIASMKIKHVDLRLNSIYQDARDVKTKFSKTFTTFFFPVGDEVRNIVTQWVTYLREVKLWGNDDPLFPVTQIIVGDSQQFEAFGLTREGWRTAAPIRAIFREAFTGAGLPYFNPHSLRKTLATLGQTLCQSAEQYKSWSQNLGHDGVMTTFKSYGEVSVSRQGEIISSLAKLGSKSATADEAVTLVMEAMRRLHHEPDIYDLGHKSR